MAIRIERGLRAAHFFRLGNRCRDGQRRLLFIPIVRRHWDLYVSGGIGILRYDWDQPNISPLRTPGLDGIGSVPMIPLGAGFR